MTREIRVVPIQGAEAGAGPRHADVIFVHGLMGDPKATWTASAADGSESFWPQWIAREFPGVAVWSVDYPTTVSRWVGRSIPLFELATNIADGLLVKDIGVNRPLILVGHSMGGLVIKKILLESSNHSQARWTLLSANAKAVMFLATPHTGSDLPALENFLETLATHLLVAGSVSSFVFSFVAKLFGRKSTSMDELKNNAPMLRDLNLSFRQYVERRRDANPLQVCVYYETQQTWGLQVVTESSADPGLPTADLVALVANHLEICKFPDEGDGARPFHRLKELLPSIIVPQGAPANTVSAPSATGPASPQETLRAEADDATLLAPRPTSLAVAELGLDDPLAGFIVCACVVTDAADELVQHIEGWKAQALGDPLVPEPVKQRARKADVSGLFGEVALRPILLDWLAVTPFSGYVYFATRDTLGTVSDVEIRRRFLVQPLADRLRKKSQFIASVQGNREDLATSLAIAADVVRSEQQRDLPSVRVAARTDRASRLLVELAQLIASATARHLSVPEDDDAALLFEHLRTRLRFAKNVATGEIHTRDRNPLP